MTAIQNEPISIVLDKYPISVQGIKNESYKDKKGVWWVSTPQGQKILKKISNSEDTLKHILHAVRHLTANGVMIPRVNRTREGAEYVNINGTCFILIDAIEGRNPSYSSTAELAKVVKGLAKFHKASEGFFPVPDSKPKIHLGIWIDDYSQQLEDMNSFYKNELSSKENNPIGKFIVNEFPVFYERGHKAISGLKGKEYKDWVESARKHGCLCHQDFAAGNLIITGAGDLYVLDTDSLTVDIPARDIRKLLNKIMKKNGKWDLELLKKIIKYYQSENPLSPGQWQVVKQDLMFPHLFIGAMNKYYYKRDKEWSSDKYFQRIREMANFEKTITPILVNFESIVPYERNE
ncbi:MAG: CotS family spore coat protein [Clostridia bacterium]|nr:CotS family spore coat protein [Clostridia bacterium]